LAGALHVRYESSIIDEQWKTGIRPVGGMLHEARFNRISVNVTAQVINVLNRFDDGGLEPAAEDMTVMTVFLVEHSGISRLDLSHRSRHIDRCQYPRRQMIVIRKKRKSMDLDC